MQGFKLSLLLFLGCSSTLFAHERDDNFKHILSHYKQQQFEYDYRKSRVESLELRDSWISPLQISYSYSKSNPLAHEQTNEGASISMNQPIFQSGGIYYGIKFAKATQLYRDLSIDMAKRKMIKNTIALVIEIKQNMLAIKKEKLQIKNAEINLLQKREEYLKGQLDSSFLNSAIIQKNVLMQALYNMQTTQEKLLDSFALLSDLDYKSIRFVPFKMISKDDFLHHNSAIEESQYNREKSRYAKDVRVVKYLPKVNLIGGYNWQKSSVGENSYYNYGFRVSIPLGINTFRDIESAKVDYLKSQITQKEKIEEMSSLYDQVMHSIKNSDKKIALSYENQQLYKKLLDDTKKLYASGYKTEYDVETLTNSLAIQKLDTKIDELTKQLELLNLYELYRKGEK